MLHCRYLQPYGFGDFHWALTHVLAMVGAFFACVLGQAYYVEGEITSKRGFPIWGVRHPAAAFSALVRLLQGTRERVQTLDVSVTQF